MEQKKFKKRARISWDEFFIGIAENAAKRTACLFHRAAAVFVDKNHHIISVGYNGPSKNDLHCNEVGCAKIHGDPITGELKRCRGVHGEINAIINSGDTAKLKGAILYTTSFPCYDCMKALNNLQIKRIVYLDEYLRIVEGSGGKKKVPENEAKELAKKRGIIYEKFKSHERQ